MSSSHSDWMKFIEFRDQLLLAEKILYTLISILIIVGNTLVLLATWRDRSLHQPNKYFVACLTVADLLVGIFIGPAIVYGLNADYKSLRDISIHLCRFMVWIDHLAITASVCTLMFISYDRYLKISKPLQYRSRMTTSKSFKIIFIIWLISTALATYSATPDSGVDGILITYSFHCRADNQTSSKQVAWRTSHCVILFFLVTVTLTMYVRIFVIGHKRQKMLRNGELGETSTVQNQRSVLRQDLKIARTLLIVDGVFCLCWLPHTIWHLLLQYYPNVDSNNWSLSYWYRMITLNFLFHLLVLFNSLCNPIIYACLDLTYREAFKRLFKKIMCRTTSNTQQPPAVIELRQLRNN